jgi:hypothetical protein
MKDGVIDPKKGPIVSGEFGSVQLHKDDQIVAGTNLFPKKQNISKPNQPNDEGITQLYKDDQIVVDTNLFLEKQPTTKSIQPNDGGITQLSSTLGNKMDIMINKLDGLINAVNKGMIVNLDGNKVSQELLTPLAIANRRI